MEKKKRNVSEKEANVDDVTDTTVDTTHSKESENNKKKSKKAKTEDTNTNNSNNNNKSDENKSDSSTTTTTTTTGRSLLLGSLTFSCNTTLFQHSSNILASTAPGLPVSAADKLFLLSLLQHGHHDFNRKLGKGILNIKADWHPLHRSTKCFILQRVDGSEEDFSYIRCVDQIFPKAFNAAPQQEKKRGTCVSSYPPGIAKCNRNKMGFKLKTHAQRARTAQKQLEKREVEAQQQKEQKDTRHKDKGQKGNDM